MSPSGRPGGEVRRATPEGAPVTPSGRPGGNVRTATPEGTRVRHRRVVPRAGAAVRHAERVR